MEVKEAYTILTNYQLLYNSTDITQVFAIREKYEKFRPLLEKSKQSHLLKRVSNVLIACDTIEKSIQDEATRVLEAREKLGTDIYSMAYRKLLDDWDKEIVSQVGKPLPHAPEIDENSHILALFDKYHARTPNEKIAAIEKETGSRVNVHARGDWREPTWKLRQMKLRAISLLYLMEKGMIKR